MSASWARECGNRQPTSLAVLVGVANGPISARTAIEHSLRPLPLSCCQRPHAAPMAASVNPLTETLGPAQVADVIVSA